MVETVYEKLRSAIKTGDVLGVQELFHNIDPNYIYTPWETPLLLAIRFKHLEIVQILLSHPDIQACRLPETEIVPLVHAVGQPEIIRLLRQHPTCRVNEIGQTVSALHDAVDRRELESFLELLQFPEINVNIRNPRNETPLFLAIRNLRFETEERMLPFIQILLEKGAKCTICSIDRTSILQMARDHGSLDLRRLLQIFKNRNN